MDTKNYLIKQEIERTQIKADNEIRLVKALFASEIMPSSNRILECHLHTLETTIKDLRQHQERIRALTFALETINAH